MSIVRPFGVISDRQSSCSVVPLIESIPEMLDCLLLSHHNPEESLRPERGLAPFWLELLSVIRVNSRARQMATMGRSENGPANHGNGANATWVEGVNSRNAFIWNHGGILLGCWMPDTGF